MHRCPAAKGVPSAALPRNPANAVAVLAAVLGSRTAEMSETQALAIHGSRAYSLATVCRVERIAFMPCCDSWCLIAFDDGMTHGMLSATTNWGVGVSLCLNPFLLYRSTCDDKRVCSKKQRWVS